MIGEFSGTVFHCYLYKQSKKSIMILDDWAFRKMKSINKIKHTVVNTVDTPSALLATKEYDRRCDSTNSFKSSNRNNWDDLRWGFLRYLIGQLRA